MFRQIFGNMPDVVKNLLILNVLFFLATAVLQGQGINLQVYLSMFFPTSIFFEPYQIITHFFMHADLFHILFNMVGLVVFGSHLERTWGKKRFFTYYIITALGAMVLHTGWEAFEIYQYTGRWFPTLDQLVPLVESGAISIEGFEQSIKIVNSPTLGASGAVYGLLMAFALLFPNTQFMLLFPPIPIKAKWLALILGGIAVYSGFIQSDGGSIAHVAHLGGMVFGFIMIKIWQRDKTKFY
ncbi:MAG: rhomboid family intramembrane serine protease [Fluviicola sp. XM-24bin1]|nr:MAG: rhomboid family intramembrane serine protease [Fluviicola sp. XM-24bin1]